MVATTKSIGIVISDFNKSITGRMLHAAQQEVEKQQGAVKKIVHVPGAFEIPFATQKLIQNMDAVVVLGVVIQGKTAHDLIIVEAIAPKLLELSLQHQKPIGFGIIGPRVSEKEAKQRSEEYAQRAVQAAFTLLNLQ